MSCNIIDCVSHPEQIFESAYEVCEDWLMNCPWASQCGGDNLLKAIRLIESGQPTIITETIAVNHIVNCVRGENLSTLMKVILPNLVAIS